MNNGQTSNRSTDKNHELGVRRGGLNGFFNYWLRSFRVTFLVLIGLAIVGIWTAVMLPRESTPEVEIPVAVVVTVYPGASSRDVEELVTKPIEEKLINVEGLDKLSSSSRLSVSSVVAEFSADEDLEDAIRRLRDEVSEIRGLPDEAELPEVMEISFEDEPIISIGLGGIDDVRLLSLYAEDLAEEIEGVAGVSQVDVAGKLDEEVRIKVEPGKLAELGISINQVIGGIRAANINAPVGQFDTDNFNYDLRLTGRFSSIGDIAQKPIVLPDGSVVELGAVADIELGVTERAAESRISTEGNRATAAVTLLVRKKTGGNIVRIVDAVEKEVEEARSELPEDLQILSFADRADEIRTQLSNVYRSGVQTLLIVFGLLWLFLGWRPAVISALAVPLTFSMAFLVFAWTGITLNGVSLFSLILSLGLLVDTTIVIVEGICGHREEEGIDNGAGGGCDLEPGDSRDVREKKLQERAASVVGQFTKPLIGGTLTTVAAFFPMLLVTGIIGQFLKVIPIVVTATLLSSLLVALAFIPPVAVEILVRMRQTEEDRWFDRVYRRVRVKYQRVISKILEARKMQSLFIATLTILLVLGLSLPFSGLLKTGLFPAVDIDFMIINVELDPGTRLEGTERVVEEIEAKLKEVPEVISYVVNVGAGVSMDLSGGGSSEELASFFVNLDKEREQSSLDISDNLRAELKDIAGAKIVIEELSAGPPSAAPVEIRIVGKEMGELDRLSWQAMQKLEEMEGVVDVDRNLRNSAGEFNFVFNEEALAEYGVSVGEIAQVLRASVFGMEVTTFLDQDGDEVAVRIEGVEEAVNSVDDILAMELVTSRGEKVVVSQVASVGLESSLDAIRHRDEERTVTITADAATGYMPNELTQEFMSRVNELSLPDGYRVEFGGEQQETVETFNQLYRSMVIAVLLILIILVVEFNSYRQPFIIFLSIPLALTGVLFGLLIFGGQLNFAAFIGLVSLTGIVVNNAIILVDRMNRVRERGASIKEAVKEATSSRLRPIMLTTLTTAGGIAPLIWVDEFFRDMAVTLITGLLFSSIITLVLIPILYYRQQTKIERKRQRKGLSPSFGNEERSVLSPVP